MHLGQVHGEVVGEPAVADPEGLGLRCLGIPHDAEPIVVGVEGHDAAVAPTELLPAADEVDGLGCQAQGSGVGMYRFLPLYGLALASAVHGLKVVDLIPVRVVCPDVCSLLKLGWQIYNPKRHLLAG